MVDLLLPHLLDGAMHSNAVGGGQRLGFEPHSQNKRNVAGFHLTAL